MNTQRALERLWISRVSFSFQQLVMHWTAAEKASLNVSTVCCKMIEQDFKT